MLPILRKAAEAAGGINELAQQVGVKRQAFYGWERVPAERVLAIETASRGKVSRHDLRPDLYPRDNGQAA